MKYRRYVWLVTGIVLAVLLFNASVWLFATRTVVSGDPTVGDLARMGYLPEFVRVDKNDGYPTARHLNIWDYKGQKIDFITLGDSFSQGKGDGYYQDWISQVTGGVVLNLNEIFWYPDLPNRLELIVNLVNDGFFDEIQPTYLLVQNVERDCLSLSRVPDWSAIDRAIEFETFLYSRRMKSQLTEVKKKGFFNTVSFKYILNKFFYFFKGYDYAKKVYVEDLDIPLFSGSSGAKVPFFHRDLWWAGQSTSEIATLVNKNMNILAELLREKGIELIFLPAVDKYDLYRDFMLAPKYPEVYFFETLRELPKSYHLIDSKEILQQLLRKGEQDVYWQDDTHWSWKASKAIAENIATVVNP